MTLRAETVGYIRQALLPSLICAALTSSAIAADYESTLESCSRVGAI